MNQKDKIRDSYRATLIASAEGRKVLLDMVVRSKLLSGLLTEADIPVANFVTTILNRCGLFGCIEDSGGVHYHISLDALIERLQDLPFETEK